MKTNYQMIKAFSDWTPNRTGWVNEDEIKTINEHFKLKERTDTELQNLRDFIVLYYSTHKIDDKDLTPKEQFIQMDILSALTGVIDIEKVNRGLEV